MAHSSTQFCDTCGAANRQGARFCRVCGNVVSTTTTIAMSNTLTGLLPKMMLKHRYVILAQAGRGGFGAVYKAKDIQFGSRLVAIKEMSRGNLEQKDLAAATASFNREAMLLENLTHPNLPRIYEQFTESGRSYLVMDFIEGETLADHLEKLAPSRLPMQKTLDIALQLCSVIEYLHTRHPPIVFRDLKPGNVMLTPSGHIYLIDFGIARHFKPGQERDTTALGSSGYAPPEQYGKSQTTTRADIYSLGATLHQLLTGDDPSETPFRFEPLNFTDPSLAGLDSLVMSMVNVVVEQRPASISLIRQQLQSIMTHYIQAMTLQSVWSAILPVSLPAISVAAPSAKQSQVQLQTIAQKTADEATHIIQTQDQTHRLLICQGHRHQISAVAWSPDGRSIASASHDKTVLIWNASDGQQLIAYQGHTAQVNMLAWSPDSRSVVSASDDQSAHVWDVATGKAICLYDGHQGSLLTVAWSPNGKYIASAGEDTTVQVWDPVTKELLVKYENHREQVHCLAWSPDGRYLASGGKDCKLSINELGKGWPDRSFLKKLFFSRSRQRTIAKHQGPIKALTWSPDSQHIATISSDHHLNVRNITRNTAFALEESWTTRQNAIAWSPTDMQVLAIAGNDKSVHVWNSLTKKQYTYHGHSDHVMTVAWSPDGSQLASGSVDCTLQVWRVGQAAEIQQ